MADDIPELQFVYSDSDCYENEIAELYSYTEEIELPIGREFFENRFGKNWLETDDHTKREFILSLLNLLDSSDRLTRVQVMRIFLYLVQGVFGECDSEYDQREEAIKSSFLLYQNGVFHYFVDELNTEVINASNSSSMRKPAVSLSDSVHIRLILNVLYTVLESIRTPFASESEERQKIREQFKEELLTLPCGDETLIVCLFGMVTKFCGGSAPHFPMKKVLLLLWKITLFTLGGLTNFHELKNAARRKADLPEWNEDSQEVCKKMRASSPPTSAADIIEQSNMVASGLKKNDKMRKQGGLEDDDKESGHQSSTPPPAVVRCLPWLPKVRQKDLESFIEHTRDKFVGLTVKGDVTSMAGLPKPIHEGIKVLKKKIYVSLSEVQMKREEEIAKYPLTKGEKEIEQNKAEILYESLFSSLPQYMIALLKILLAAAPTSKARTDSVNILADVLPEEMPTTVLHSMKLGIDVNRHKEIIVKAISSLILLLLKHFKLNHIYQFEYMSQHLVFANCIPLILKFFNQNIVGYVTAKNTISILDFPRCVIGEQLELTADTLESGDSQAYCWRNLFSCINLLRILNKLTKWKHSRTMMLVIFKSAPILKRAMKILQAMAQLYILKLLKMQTKYLGRQWRKNNMKIMSAIYQKVRHRLNDDWAYGNDMDARPWDFQAEECALRSNVDRFNSRRYEGNIDPDLAPVDNCLQSVLGKPVELTSEFKRHYETWMEEEVFTVSIKWDEVLNMQ